MKILAGEQTGAVQDAVTAKFAMVVPVLRATLHSLARDRIERLGGLGRVTLHDLAREFREGHGDAGICFEYAVHEAIAARNPLISDIVSEVLEDLCRIPGRAESLLFGPEKEGVIPVLETVQQALTPESIVYVGNRGRPPKLKRYVEKIVRAYRRHEERNRLPRCISGLWKADLFLGNTDNDAWVGTTVKINPAQLQGAEGLRIGIYPKQNDRDCPRKDDDLNLIRVPLPYDGQFMEIFYKSFFLIRQFLLADAEIPRPVHLPDAEDRLVSEQLARRRGFPIVEVLPVLAQMGQRDLIAESEVEDARVNALLSEAAGLETGQQALNLRPTSEAVSITPNPRST